MDKAALDGMEENMYINNVRIVKHGKKATMENSLGGPNVNDIFTGSDQRGLIAQVGCTINVEQS